MRFTDDELWTGTLHDHFRLVAAEQPERIAVDDGVEAWTYQQLDERSHAWCAALLRHFSERVGAVALLIPKGRELLAAMLGVMKAGGHFVCFDETMPEKRRAAISKDIGVVATIALNKAAAAFENAGHVLTPEALGANQDKEVALPSVDGSDPCFIINTSGTTRDSLSIVVTHRSWLHTVYRYGEYMKLGPEDRFTWLAAPGTSAGMSAPLTALLHGAATHPFDVRTGGLTAMVEWLEGHRITVYHSTPTLFRSLIHSLEDAQILSDIRLVRLGGEQAYASDLNLFQRHFKQDALFLNGYGSSEAGYVSCHVMDQKQQWCEGPLPVGKVAKGHHVRIVDTDGRTLPEGEVGEIVLKSKWLPRGYASLPELTTQCFRPIADEPQVREFSTGDLGLFISDEVLIHCGRKDDQIKVRGLRVEPIAVESTLRAIDGVRDVAVLMNDRGELCSFIVTDRRLLQIKNELGSILATNMVPSKWIRLKQMKFTSTGKVDRRYLLNLVPTDIQGVPPRNELEGSLVDLWNEVLQRKHVGVYDDFFALGGTSLDALEMLALMETDLGYKVTPTRLMERSTIAQLAEIIDGEAAQQHQHDLVALRLTGQLPPVFIFPGGWAGENEMLVFASMLPSLPVDHPIYGMRQQWMNPRLEGSLSFDALVTNAVKHLKSVFADSPCIIIGECIASVLATEIARQLGTQVLKLILMDPTLINLSTHESATLPPAVDEYRRALHSASIHRATCDVQLIGCLDEPDMESRLAEWQARLGGGKITRVKGNHDSYIRENGLETARVISQIIHENQSSNNQTSTILKL